MMAEAYELELTKVDAGKVRVVVQGERRRTRPMTLTREQIGAVLERLPPADRLLFEFLSWTGLRISEGLAATWGDVEQTPQGPVVVVRDSKTEDGERSVALVPTLAHSLIRHRANTRYPNAADPIFPTVIGTVQDSHNVRNRLRPATKAAGVPWATPHKFRHSLASELRDHGYDANMIARVLGDTDPSFTARVYIHAPDAPRFDALAPAIEAAE
jgi:integrase